jgi:hypothetical protein
VIMGLTRWRPEILMKTTRKRKPTNRRSCASRTKTRARCLTQKAAKVSLGGLCRCVCVEVCRAERCSNVALAC